MNRVAVLSIASLALSACASPAGVGTAPPAGDQAPVAGGQLNMVVATDPLDWDPTSGGRSDPGEDGLAVAYNSLLSFKFGPDVEYSRMEVQPALAERWETSPDGKNFTFYLRKGAKYAPSTSSGNVGSGSGSVKGLENGREVTARDVKFSMEYYSRTGEFADKKLPASRNDLYFEGMQAVSTPDPYTVQFSFKEPFVPFISYMASGRAPVAPREIYDQDGHLKDRIIGTGPFQHDPEASQKGTRWVFKKNPTYWETGKAYLDEIRWIVVKSGATALAAFQTKQIDRMDAMDFRAVEEVTKLVPDARSFKYMESQADKFRMSWQANQPTADVRVRKAVSLALDRDEINKVYAGGQGVWGLAGSFIGLFTEEEVRGIYKQDVVEAKRLLAEAGYPNGLNLALPADDSRSQEVLSMYTLVQAQLKRAGINVDMQVLDRNLQRQRRRAGDFGLDGSQGAGSADADQDSTLYGDFHSSQAGSGNSGYVRDGELDRLLNAQRREPDPAKRRELQREAARRIAEIMAAAGTIHTPKWDMVQSYVQNYHPHFSVKAPYAVSWIRK